MSIFSEKKCFSNNELMEMLEEAMELGVKKGRLEMKEAFDKQPKEMPNVEIINLRKKVKDNNKLIDNLLKENDKNIKALNIKKSTNSALLQTIYEQQLLLEKIAFELQTTKRTQPSFNIELGELIEKKINKKITKQKGIKKLVETNSIESNIIKKKTKKSIGSNIDLKT